MASFAYAGCPAEYPGDTFWWTLRFAGEPPPAPPAPGELVRLHLSWPEAGRSEWVDASTLAVGDAALGGTIVALTEIAGAKAFKVDLGRGATRILPLRSLEPLVERRVAKAPSRNLQLEADRPVDDAKLLRYLDRVHAVAPLVAVVFQEGQLVDGEPLVGLDDATLVARLRAR